MSRIFYLWNIKRKKEAIRIQNKILTVQVVLNFYCYLGSHNVIYFEMKYYNLEKGV